jgi:hypothetical protein
MNVFIRPYKIGSESARMLARKLGLKRIRGDKRIITPTVLLNWGGSTIVSGNVRYINHPNSVAVAKNKLDTFINLTMSGIYTPPFTTSETVARQWVEEGSVVYGRQLLEAGEGRGIVVLTQDSEWQRCPLYTKGIQKPHEYRVHVVKGEVIDYTKKRRRSEAETSDYIRNSSNGWVFCRDGVSLPQVVSDAAISAVESLGLDFGAVDVAYKQAEDRAYVFEVNTAPGIEATTLEKYTQAIRSVLQSEILG